MAGKFIVIEGTDGSGKRTQFNLLVEHLKGLGHQTALFDFPRYGQPSAYFVEQYLAGSYGSAEDVGPFRGAMFYAMDRYAASFEINEAISADKLVLSNRYIGSNMAHQGGKLRDPQKRKDYYEWCRKMELLGMQIPAPDMYIVLHVAASKAFENVNARARGKDSTSGKQDVVHESDLQHLINAEEAYGELCEIYPDIFTQVECMNGDQLLTIEQIAALVWQKVEPILAQ